LKRLDGAIERLLLYVAMHASGRGMIVVMAALYGGVGLLLPIVAGANMLYFVAFNFMAAMTAFTFGLVWFAVRVQQVQRRNLVEWTTDLRLLDAREFEWLVGEVFRRDGWKVDEVGSHGSPDGNVDLRMTRGKQRAIVQCKRWQSWHVGVDEIRKFAGTVMGEGRATTSGYFVTLSDFTPQAMQEGRRLGFVLIGGVELYKRAEKLRRREPCPICTSPMVLDRSVHGWWFRCTTAGCNGKRDLGSQPGRAIVLLTDNADCVARAGKAPAGVDSSRVQELRVPTRQTILVGKIAIPPGKLDPPVVDLLEANDEHRAVVLREDRWSHLDRVVGPDREEVTVEG
jgi:hypothetical protein